MKKTILTLALAAAAALAPALAKGALDSVTILDAEGVRVLARSDVRGGNAELLLASLPAGTKVKVVETDVDGERRVFDAEVRADGEIAVDVDADGKADKPLRLELGNRGVSLYVEVVKGEGATVSVTSTNATAAGAIADPGAPEGTPSGAPEGTPSGAPAGEGSTYTAPTAPVAPPIPPRR